MIVEFKLQNFLSIGSEQTLSFLASKDKTNEKDYVVEMPDGTRLLRVAIIFGANSTGKSAILKGLDFFRRLNITPLPNDQALWAELKPFRFDPKYANLATEMSMTFYIKGKKYVLTISMHGDVILDESLDVYNSTRSSNVYHRYHKPNAKPRVFFSERLVKLVQRDKNLITDNVTDNSTVIAAFARSNCADCVLADVYDYFLKGFAGFYATTDSMLDNVRVMMRNIKEPAFKNFLKKWIKNGGFTAIDDFSMDEKDKFTFLHSVCGSNSETVEEEESDGFKRYFGMESLLYMLDKSVCLVMIDRLDKDVHPKLRRLFIRAFLKDGKRNSQLAFTTHAFYALDKDFIRRDSVWFTRRVMEGDAETELIRLNTCKVHKSVSAHNSYKRGVIVEPPKIGNFFMSDDELKEFGLTEDDVVSEKE